jgi:alpha-glucosidase
MEDVPIPPELVQDPPAVNQPEIAHIVGRDPERTPMQWDASPNAGFATPACSRGCRFLMTTRSEKRRGAKSGRQIDAAFFRALTTLRQSTPALTIGDYASVETGVDNIFAYTRTHGDERLLVVLNFAATTHRLNLSHLAPTPKSS